MKKLVFAVGVLTVVVGIVWAGITWNTWRANLRTAKFNEDVENLFVGLQKYKEHVGAYPVGGNAEIAKALMGHNAKNVIVIVGRNTEVNEKGEFVDPWSTPLQIYFSDNGVLVRSAGPNRRFDDSTVIGGDDVFRSN